MVKCDHRFEKFQQNWNFTHGWEGVVQKWSDKSFYPPPSLFNDIPHILLYKSHSCQRVVDPLSADVICKRFLITVFNHGLILFSFGKWVVLIDSFSHILCVIISKLERARSRTDVNCKHKIDKLTNCQTQ